MIATKFWLTGTREFKGMGVLSHWLGMCLLYFHSFNTCITHLNIICSFCVGENIGTYNCYFSQFICEKVLVREV